MPDDLKRTYDQIAIDYVKDHEKDTWDDDYIEYFSKALTKNAKVLDLGCGPGLDSEKLHRHELSVEGFDLSDELLKNARNVNPGMVFTQGDMRRLPYPAESFDGVFAKASLLHIPKKDIPIVLDEIRRVLKPKGIVHIAVKGGEGEGLLTENDYGYEYSRFFSYWKIEDFLQELTKHNFLVTKSEIWQRTEFSYTIWIKVLAQKAL